MGMGLGLRPCDLVAQEGLQPIREHLNTPGNMLAVRIEERHRQRFGLIGRHDLHEPACFEMTAHVIGRNLDEPE